MIKEGWYDGVLMAVQALKEGKSIQINFDSNPEKWEDYAPMNDGEGFVFMTSCSYRAKPEPKLRPLTPQEWLEALMAGKTIGENGLTFDLSVDQGGV